MFRSINSRLEKTLKELEEEVIVSLISVTLVLVEIKEELQFKLLLHF